MANVAYMFLGAFLVTLGVLGSATADRIRGRYRTDTRGREKHATGEPVKREQAPRAREDAGRTTPAHDAMARDVAEVLTGAGYRKSEAAAAVAACKPSEQSSLEAWTRAALRHAMGDAGMTTGKNGVLATLGRAGR